MKINKKSDDEDDLKTKNKITNNYSFSFNNIEQMSEETINKNNKYNNYYNILNELTFIEVNLINKKEEKINFKESIAIKNIMR